MNIPISFYRYLVLSTSENAKQDDIPINAFLAFQDYESASKISRLQTNTLLKIIEIHTNGVILGWEGIRESLKFYSMGYSV